jgi:hypothetical protein
VVRCTVHFRERRSFDAELNRGRLICNKRIMHTKFQSSARVPHFALPEHVAVGTRRTLLRAHHALSWTAERNGTYDAVSSALQSCRRTRPSESHTPPRQVLAAWQRAKGARHWLHVSCVLPCMPPHPVPSWPIIPSPIPPIKTASSDDVSSLTVRTH